MKNPGIGYCDYALPECTMSMEHFVSVLPAEEIPDGISRDQFKEILNNTLGYQSVYIEERHKEPLMFKHMLDKYFSSSQSKPEEVDVLIYANGDSIALGNPWDPSNAECVNVPYFLKREFGMDNALVLNIDVECAGTLVATRIAMSMFRDFPLSRRVMADYAIVSDGVALMELSATNGELVILDFASVADGRISKVVHYKEKAQLLITTGVELIGRIAKKNALLLSDIKMIIPQNTTRVGWNSYCKQLGYPRDRVFLRNVADGGHMGDVDIIRNLVDVQRQELLAKGDRVIAYAVGTGTTWAALLLQKR
jgi:3-oxoacyl-[acyl-carrier-protein] synthase III